MLTLTTLGYVAGILTFLAYPLYAFSIIREHSRPSRSTWFIWSVLTILIAVSYYLSGATDTLPAAIGAAAGTLFIAILSIFYGVGGWDPLDRWMILVAVAGIIVWMALDSPVYALLAFLTADLAGAVPTASKVRREPASEAWYPWTATVAANALTVLTLGVFAVEEWEFGVAVYPLYMTAINGLILFFILRPRLKRLFGESPAQ